ncbi:hypothetical protein C8J56DRAFT_1042631 [Mycena floridula]|nr:hypothetical protein C8J56DRAFT_1042631 [Mycena floridula]
MRLRLYSPLKEGRDILRYALQSPDTRLVIQNLSLVATPELFRIWPHNSMSWSGKAMPCLKALHVQVAGNQDTTYGIELIAHCFSNAPALTRLTVGGFKWLSDRSPERGLD